MQVEISSKLSIFSIGIKLILYLQIQNIKLCNQKLYLFLCSYYFNNTRINSLSSYYTNLVLKITQFVRYISHMICVY